MICGCRIIRKGTKSNKKFSIFWMALTFAICVESGLNWFTVLYQERKNIGFEGYKNIIIIWRYVSEHENILNASIM